MTEQMIRGTEVTRPTPEPLTSTLLDHANVTDIEHFGLRNNAGMWNSYNCLDLMVPTPICPEPLLADEGGFKQFRTAEWQPAFEFAVYGGVQCSAVGLDRVDQFSEAKRVFERSEARGVEEALMFTRLLDPQDGDAPLWDYAEDITPGADLSVAQALALLEGHAARHYLGVPTLHLPRAAVVMAFGQGLITERDGKFYTKTGAKVAAGGGYDIDIETGVWRLFATGEVSVERSSKIEVQEYVIPGDGSGVGSDMNGLADNTVISLVERMYRVTVDCYAVMVTATVWG